MKPAVFMVRAGFALDLAHDWTKELKGRVELVVSFDVETRRYHAIVWHAGAPFSKASFATSAEAVVYLQTAVRSVAP